MNGDFSKVFALVLSSLLLALCHRANAAQVVDQSFTNPPYSSAAVTSLTGDTLFAQSFTVGKAGQLTGVDILAFDGTSWYGANSSPVSDMTLQICTFSGGVPTTTVLASYSVPASHLVANPNGKFIHVDFPTGVTVAPGQVLALTIGGSGIGCYLQIGGDTNYAGGQAFVKEHAGYSWTPYPDPGGRGADFFFQTYVNVTNSASARAVSSEFTNETFHARYVGVPNHLFTIDRAGNSAGTWQLGYTNVTSDSNGEFEVFDSISPTAARFYRAR